MEIVFVNSGVYGHLAIILSVQKSAPWLQNIQVHPIHWNGDQISVSIRNEMSRRERSFYGIAHSNSAQKIISQRMYFLTLTWKKHSSSHRKETRSIPHVLDRILMGTPFASIKYPRQRM